MPSLSKPIAVPAPAAIAAGTGVSCYGLERKTLTLEAAGTATYQAQISCALADADGGTVPAGGDASWVNYGTALTTSGVVEITAPANWVRWNATAWTNGTPVSKLVGYLNMARG